MAKLDKDYEFPLYIFHSGKNYKAYEFFGCHRIKRTSRSPSGLKRGFFFSSVMLSSL